MLTSGTGNNGQEQSQCPETYGWIFEFQRRSQGHSPQSESEAISTKTQSYSFCNARTAVAYRSELQAKELIQTQFKTQGIEKNASISHQYPNKQNPVESASQ